MALLDEVKLAQRFDLAIMSSKGMSVIAARELADEVCHRWHIPLFILHDFDKAGFSIRAGFMQRQSRRYTFQNQIKVIDLGLRMDDVRHLIRAGKDEAAAKEKGSARRRRANMLRNGATRGGGRVSAHPAGRAERLHVGGVHRLHRAQADRARREEDRPDQGHPRRHLSHLRPGA